MICHNICATNDDISFQHGNEVFEKYIMSQRLRLKQYNRLKKAGGAKTCLFGLNRGGGSDHMLPGYLTC